VEGLFFAEMASILDHVSNGDEDCGKYSVAKRLIRVDRLYFFLIYVLFLYNVFNIFYFIFLQHYLIGNQLRLIVRI